MAKRSKDAESSVKTYRLVDNELHRHGARFQTPQGVVEPARHSGLYHLDDAAVDLLEKQYGAKFKPAKNAPEPESVNQNADGDAILREREEANRIAEQEARDNLEANRAEGNHLAEASRKLPGTTKKAPRRRKS